MRNTIVIILLSVALGYAVAAALLATRNNFHLVSRATERERLAGWGLLLVVTGLMVGIETLAAQRLRDIPMILVLSGAVVLLVVGFLTLDYVPTGAALMFAGAAAAIAGVSSARRPSGLQRRLGVISVTVWLLVTGFNFLLAYIYVFVE